MSNSQKWYVSHAETIVQKIQPNPNKSGVRVITPSGESYVCGWDLASKDGEE